MKGKNAFLSRNFYDRIGLMLRQTNAKKNANEFLQGILMCAIALSAFASALAFYFFQSVFYSLLAALGIALLFIFGRYFLLLYKFEMRRRSIESAVPDLLLQASIFPESAEAAKIIEYLSKADYAALSEEFNKALLEIRKGASIETALKNMSLRNNSRILSRALELIIQGYNSGAKMSKIFREAAEDMLETRGIIRERIATMTIEKYTLLLAGGIIVPLVLGLLVGLVTKLDFVSADFLQIGMGASERKLLLDSALLANQLYIAEYSLLASFFVANMENNIKKAVIYACILMPLSFAVYMMAQVL